MTKDLTKKNDEQLISTTRPAEPVTGAANTTASTTGTGTGTTPGTLEETGKIPMPGTTKPAPGTTGTPGTMPGTRPTAL